MLIYYFQVDIVSDQLTIVISMTLQFIKMHASQASGGRLLTYPRCVV